MQDCKHFFTWFEACFEFPFLYQVVIRGSCRTNSLPIFSTRSRETRKDVQRVQVLVGEPGRWWGGNDLVHKR